MAPDTPERVNFALAECVKGKHTLKISMMNHAADRKVVYGVLIAISVAHLLNDMIQSVIPAIYPILKEEFGFNFAQIGLITLIFQITSSILQPVTGWYADRRPQPYALTIGMGFTLVGLCLMAVSANLLMIIASVALIGCGSSVFHPGASRVAQLASGGRKSLAQSIFQVGGNGGAAIGPLAAAAVVIPFGRGAVGWFAVAALLAMALLTWVGGWYGRTIASVRERSAQQRGRKSPYPRHTVRRAMTILVVMIFSKYFYISCMTSYFTFFLIDKFSISVQESQICLFAFLAALAAGTVIGGFLGDRYGRKYVILGSIFGAGPFALLTPYCGLWLTVALSVVAGLIIASAFSAILVYATDLMPDRVGMIAGIFFGLMFGLGGLGSAIFGWLADLTDIEFIFRVSTLLPLLGIVAISLPDVRPLQEVDNEQEV